MYINIILSYITILYITNYYKLLRGKNNNYIFLQLLFKCLNLFIILLPITIICNNIYIYLLYLPFYLPLYEKKINQDILKNYINFPKLTKSLSKFINSLD